ncbi:receptor-interacting serine/threonine-protein kinase 1-like [Ostrea edulis]|uniref:receptor-interacting serine/threonine-protein kinase 1-like n=1 Tax=Ostrea edulis TaxID=37623 RepID=UPI0024AFD84F|nr:receptor-interacting serine/threonine-protein kinase 1-like [Ostrea edulis]XP_056009212.1 receptor-interacting serine/threonine-protein kinase 1-like [Ostrea edulis]XP_056009213.1 receptor-interacting serine/threonine-protein kinase 1-like [Ostrea edulis]
MEDDLTCESEIETDARPGSADSPKKSRSSDQTRVIQYEHRGGGRTTIHLPTDSKEKLPNIQIGDQNFMVVGDPSGSSSSQGKKKVKKKDRKKIEVPDRALTDEECDLISENLGRDYKKFCRRLGFKDVQIEQVELDFKDEGHYEVTYQLLRKLKQLGKDKLQTVVDTLLSIDRGDIVDELNIT